MEPCPDFPSMYTLLLFVWLSIVAIGAAIGIARLIYLKIVPEKGRFHL